jgi:small subunit ribosomal protein S2
MAIANMKELLETGVHFGHRTRKWNPRMKPFIFTERNNIHIIDLQQTLDSLIESYGLTRDIVAEGGNILFVGTKRQAQETIELEARRCGMPYVNARWLGGTLTNWRTIRSRIDELNELERRRDDGELELLTKKEALTITRRIDKLQERLGGIRDMKSVPDLIYAVDVRKEETAIHEANLLKIPVIALVDTNCDPRGVDYVIPSNDDAIRAIKLLTSTIANAALEGMEMRKDREEDEDQIASAPQEIPATEMTDEELLGEATLAKLQSGEFDEKLASPEDEAAPEKAKAEQAEADSEAETKTTDAESDAEEAEAEEEQTEAEEDGADEAVAESDEDAEAVAEPDEDAEAVAEPDEAAEAVAEPDEDAEAGEDAEAANVDEADAEDAKAVAEPDGDTEAGEDAEAANVDEADAEDAEAEEEAEAKEESDEPEDE